MSKVIQIFDKPDALVPTRMYPHAKWSFDHFNPPQSAIFDTFERDANICVAAATSAGKTVAAEMYLAHEVRVRGGKGMYVGPLKALAQEKIDDWTNPDYHFHDQKISICTGDYVLTDARKKELAEANLILMTSEMLASRCRNHKSEKSNFLKEVGTLVIDESHLLTVPGRGHHLEVAMMKITDLNPDIRVVLLSATMPNVDEICGWLSQKLTGKKTYLLESTYRPCPLNLHYEKYFDGSRDYDATELEKVVAALDIVEDYPEDKFLIFAHTKRTGELMKIALARKGIAAEFHNADLEKAKRNLLENKFKSDPAFRVIIATSTLAWGLNLPARRVIILGVHRGMGLVETYDISQMVGRAGRPAYDPAGDAYILLPERKFREQQERLLSPTEIRSQLLSKGSEGETNTHALAFHLVSEIHHRSVKTVADIHHWYERSLAYFQNRGLGVSCVDAVIDRLTGCGAIKVEDGEFVTTPVGTIASMFYFNPVDVSDLKRNFSAVFAEAPDDDIRIAIALGNVETNRLGFVSKAERDEMGMFAAKVTKAFGNKAIPEPAVKAAFCYYNLINGNANATFNTLMRGFQYDFPRANQVLQMIDSMAAKWGKKEYIDRLRLRVQYGVKGPQVYLCEVPNIGGVRAQKLWDAGIKSVADMANNPGVVKKALNMKQESVDKIIEDARLLKMQRALKGK